MLYIRPPYLCRDTRIRTWDPLLPKQVRYPDCATPRSMVLFRHCGGKSKNADLTTKREPNERCIS